MLRSVLKEAGDIAQGNKSGVQGAIVKRQGDMQQARARAKGGTDIHCQAPKGSLKKNDGPTGIASEH